MAATPRRQMLGCRPPAADGWRRTAGRKGILALALLTCLCGLGCGDASSPSQPTPTPTPAPPPCTGLTLSALMSDPAGDGAPSSHADLVRFRAAVTGCQLGMTITFAPGTLSRNDTHWQVMLDTDENAATGFSGRDAGHTDVAAMGGDYFVERGSDGDHADVENTVGGVIQTVPVTIAGDQASLVVPLATLGNDDGRMVFSVTVSRQLAPGATTAILDYLPDKGAPLPRTR